MCSDTAWSIPWCAAVRATISVEGPLSAVGAPLCEVGDDGTEGRTEEGGAACVKWATQYNWNGAVFGSPACTVSAEQALPLLVDLAAFDGWYSAMRGIQ